ncbi:MAG: type II toxin-antitoxin system RelE/ParE family toxin [Candidatus Omnitrophica bacterium]|nr:type II toxin-antitoxin system RelE/ParE family toxin [Candidatus Omnitrophota bacterium]MBU4479024.1 type II toxin-antitoxin system RelE/ParE family toxin [Candidatus Omnitrophota bacterium]
MGQDKIKNIYYFVDGRGNNPVKEFISGLSLGERAKVFAYIMELKKQGNNLHRPLSDYLGHGIYELRPKANRVFYFFFLKDNAVLVHAIRKKTNKIPLKDLEVCIKRKFSVEEHAKVEKFNL